MKRVLIIHTSLNGGGAERVLIDLLKHIDKKSYAIDLLLVYGGGVYLGDIPGDINLLGPIFPEGYNFPLWRRILSVLGIVRKYRKKDIEGLVRGRYDTIVSFMESRPVKYHSFIMDRADRNVTWVHTDMLSNHWTRFAFDSDAEEGRIYNRMDSIVFVSEGIRDTFNRRFDISDKSRETVIYNTVDKGRILRDADIPVPGTREGSGFSIIAAGRLVPQKNFGRLIEAASILRDAGLDFTLSIIGEGPLREALEKRILALGLEDRVKLPGYCTNPYPYIKDSELVVSSSDSEGLPTVICEAFVLGRPVVATDIPASRELLGDSQYGIVTECNASSLALGIKRMITEPRTYSRYARLSLERAGLLSVEEALAKVYSIL